MDLWKLSEAEKAVRLALLRPGGDITSCRLNNAAANFLKRLLTR